MMPRLNCLLLLLHFSIMTDTIATIRKHKEILLVAAVLLLLSVFLFHKSLTLFPSHVHAWTQSDRYALAIGFLENGFDFFHPATLNLQPKYPPKIPLDHPAGITSVDFPIVEYLVAGLMWITGFHQPWVFRSLVLLIALLGLLAFYSSLRKLGLPVIFAVLMMLVALLAPVHLYYVDGFIPSVPALALAFVSWNWYISYLNEKRFRHYIYAVAAISLSALIRSPFLLPLLAMTAVQLSVHWKGKSLLKREMLVSFVGLSVVLFYRIYNDYLSTVYGSMFISSLMPATSPEALMELLKQSWNNWKWSYFSLPQYLVLAVGIALSLAAVKRQNHLVRQLLAFAALYLLAAVAYFVAMAQQFPAHDYYFLDSFFVPVLLLASVGYRAVSVEPRWLQIVSATGLVLLAGWMMFAAFQSTENRYAYKSWDRAEMTRLNFEGGAALLEKAGIGADEKIVVLDAYTSNTALLLLNRKGYAVINTSRKNMAEALTTDANYVAIQNRFLFSDVLRNMPELRTEFMPVANNGRVGIYSRQHLADKMNHADLLGLNQQQRLMQLRPSIGDTAADGFWCLNEGQQFLPLLDTILDQTWPGSYVLYFQSMARVLSAEQSAFSLVLDVSDEEGFRWYDSFPFEAFFENQQLETKLAVLMNLPAKSPKKTRVKCYLYNPKMYYLCFKNLTFNIFDYNNILLNNSLQNNEKH